MNVIYEDNHLLIIEKPVNVPIQADNSQDQDLLSMAKQYIKKKYNKPGKVYLGLVHRLDRPVGGIVVFARTSKAASRLSDQLRRQAIERGYLAIVRSQHLIKKGTLTHYLYKDRIQNQVYIVDSDHAQAKKAVLNYEVLETILHEEHGPLSLVKINLETGRSHQIRVQFANIDASLWGDQKYGSNQNKYGQQIALWAFELGMTHPTKKDWMTFHLSPPETPIWSIFKNTIESLKK
ncbi:RluA family pseudouridine synthase [Facklamia sp. DSM 111018]|uniref:RNA pseudouridylate synthase n=1 Tax=Facklamia lactis TaxID=2749967 RepID=A0ABS0LMY0_9LACT|nr:RluA family pseudouridine synthase [Facklamia lactis]MBG9979916.1 RluA family pseudouridine synthase [Facklamia lactis]MBG9985404.1 RluA family pseudouridine synthase [Facklamia lactis]